MRILPACSSGATTVFRKAHSSWYTPHFVKGHRGTTLSTMDAKQPRRPTRGTGPLMHAWQSGLTPHTLGSVQAAVPL